MARRTVCIAAAISMVSASLAGVTFSGATSASTTSFAQLSAQQTRVAPRDRPPMRGTSRLNGTVVTDDADRRPVARAVVTLFVPGDARRQWMATTDDAGRFAFDRLPAGHVTLFASKPGYIRSYYGARRPGGTVGTPIAVPDGGGTVANIVVSLTRGAVIAGTVFDDRGRPAPGVQVRPQRLGRAPDGTRKVSPAGAGTIAAGGMSDDRGVYRIYGLPPGDYVVSAEPTLERGLQARIASDIRQLTDADVAAAERRFATAAVPADAPVAPPRTVAFAEVFHPSALSLEDATTLTLAAGEERPGVDLRLRLVPTARVEGRIVDAAGQPAADAQLILNPRRATNAAEAQSLAMIELGLTSGVTARTSANGVFSLPGVQPGDYTLIARTVGSSSSPLLWAAADVSVNGQDVTGLTLTLAPGMTISGRVDVNAPAADAVRVQLRFVGLQRGLLTRTLLVRAGETFSAAGMLPGLYRLTVTVPGQPPTPNPLTLQSAVIAARDVADTPFELRRGEDVEMAITVTDRLGSVSGTVFDSAGRATSELALILFPADRAFWFADSRRLRPPVRAASDGRFLFAGLPAGQYLLAALHDADPAEWASPEFLEQLVAGALPVSVRDGERATRDVRVK